VLKKSGIILVYQDKKYQILPAMNNKYLIEACKNGDQKAQLQVYKQYFPQMFNISYNLVNNEDAAVEIVKESFLFVFERINIHYRRTDFISCIKKLVEDRSVETWKKRNIMFPGLIIDRALIK
jgi:hypothetical protein